MYLSGLFENHTLSNGRTRHVRCNFLDKTGCLFHEEPLFHISMHSCHQGNLLILSYSAEGFTYWGLNLVCVSSLWHMSLKFLVWMTCWVTTSRSIAGRRLEQNCSASNYLRKQQSSPFCKAVIKSLGIFLFFFPQLSKWYLVGLSNRLWTRGVVTELILF